MATGATITDPTEMTPEEAEARRIQREKNQAAIDLLDSWIAEGDPVVLRERRETLEFLLAALDERRTHRRLLP